MMRRNHQLRAALSREPDPLERERLQARHVRETRGYVRIPPRCPFYLRHLGLLDVTPSPISDRPDRMPDIIRSRP